MRYIPYRMYNKIRNLGDAINPHIIENVGRAPSVYSPKSKPHILGIGSIFFDAGMNSYVWGSGMINAEKAIPSIDPQKICALRGKKTVSALTSMGYKVPDVPLGDPGFLLSKLYTPCLQEKKRFKACVIPHHASIGHPAFRKFNRMDDVCLFNILTDDISAIKDLQDSELVISQSLHGLIFAEALGIPSVWISDRFDHNWKFKFEDWYSTTEYPQKNPLPLDTSFAELVQHSRLNGSLIDVDDLSEALPINDVIAEPNFDFVPHKKCKELMPLRKHFTVPGSCVNKLTQLGNIDKDRLESIVKKEFKQENAAMSHPVYSLLGEGVDDISADVVDRMMSVMDQKHGFVFASVVKDNAPPMLSKVYNIEGLKVTKNQHVGKAFLLRPNGRMNFSNEFLTFFI